MTTIDILLLSTVILGLTSGVAVLFFDRAISKDREEI